ncbi:N-acetyl-D-Glu racemase DgcA [Vibrio sp. TH_r3]|uniref:N-acetyl-D-Glu racemase DgcA n=1 Tax=Vibrio sp. TH_r3 TaxID=3082084 RepID=UPI002952D93A|nr:N-acetyl-D-Glu racemase DgcA [Vibrio sp. TH_r3]MDV7103778.1 N-acetyl-D-Glu racemase DgcA [Vibrio sp. TH_r3]
MQISFKVKSWPIRGSFTISRGSKTQVDVIQVTIVDNGVVGRGECVPYARYNESIDSTLTELENVLPTLKQGISRSALQSLLPSGAARNAVDCALWDLECKQNSQSIWERTGATSSPERLVTAFTLSLDTPEKMKQVAIDNAFRPLLKLKLGGGEDLARVAAVREGSPNATIILDANEAWTPELYQQLIPELVKLDVAMIEQPFAAGEDQALESLPRPIPICADESCHDRASLEQIIGRYDMINIKIDKTGGLTEALALKQQAQEAGLQVMVGCMLSSSLSMAPAFVVAQGVDIVDLDGPLLLSEDIEHGFTFEDSFMLPFSTELWG